MRDIRIFSIGDIPYPSEQMLPPETSIRSSVLVVDGLCFEATAAIGPIVRRQQDLDAD